MRRFLESFAIWQALAAESSETKICYPLADKFANAPILQTVSVESPDQSSQNQIDQTPSDQMQSSICQTQSSEFLPHRILQAVPGEFSECYNHLEIAIRLNFWYK